MVDTTLLRREELTAYRLIADIVFVGVLVGQFASERDPLFDILTTVYLFIYVAVRWSGGHA